MMKDLMMLQLERSSKRVASVINFIFIFLK